MQPQKSKKKSERDQYKVINTDPNNDEYDTHHIMYLTSRKYQIIFCLSLLWVFICISGFIIAFIIAFMYDNLWLLSVPVSMIIITYLVNLWLDRNTNEDIISKETDPFKYLSNASAYQNHINIKHTCWKRDTEYYVDCKFHCFTEAQLQLSSIDKSKYYENVENIQMIQFNISFSHRFDEITKQQIIDYIETTKNMDSVKEHTRNLKIDSTTTIWQHDPVTKHLSGGNIYKNAYDPLKTNSYDTKLILSRSHSVSCANACFCLFDYLCIPLIAIKNVIWLCICESNRRSKQCLIYNINIYNHIQSQGTVVVNGYLRLLEAESKINCYLQTKDIMDLCRKYIGEIKFPQTSEFCFMTSNSHRSTYHISQ
eukprot:396997_1